MSEEHGAALSHVQAAAYLGLGKTKYFELKRGDSTFPRPVTIAGMERMLRAELDAWLAARVADRDAGTRIPKSREHLAAHAQEAAQRSVAVRRERRGGGVKA